METESLEEKKKLNVIAITDFTRYGDVAVRFGAVLAKIFQSSLTIISNFKNDRAKEHSSQPESSFSSNFKQLLDELSKTEIKIELLIEPFNTAQLHQYAEETQSFIYVIGVANRRKLTYFYRKRAFKFIKTSRLPVMVVGEEMPNENTFKHVILPLDVERNSKEKAMWAAYFNRFYQATIHILYPVFKDAFLKGKVQNNLAFVKKLYKNLTITYQEHSIKPAVDNIDLYSLEFSQQVGATLTVIMMTRYKSMIDILFGVKEKKLIANSRNFPVLCLNERDDLYVLCT
jgi:hypothetical protein